MRADCERREMKRFSWVLFALAAIGVLGAEAWAHGGKHVDHLSEQDTARSEREPAAIPDAGPHHEGASESLEESDEGEWHAFREIPPLHPILVNFTAALLPISFLSDLLGRVLRRQSMSFAGLWALSYGAIVSPLTALTGWFWKRDLGDMHHPEMVIHQWLGVVLAVVVILLAVWRWRFSRAGEAPSRSYLLVTGVAFLALIVQGELGGAMSFGGNG